MVILSYEAIGLKQHRIIYDHTEKSTRQTESPETHKMHTHTHTHTQYIMLLLFQIIG